MSFRQINRPASAWYWSARAYYRVPTVARAIADVEGNEPILANKVSEAWRPARAARAV